MPLTQLLFSFNGRISRQPYWLFMLVVVVVMFVPTIFFFGFGSDSAETYANIVAVVFLWPALAVQAKRWHDRDKSAWWLLINIIPVVGFFWPIIENGFLEGTLGANRFGINPLSIEHEA